MLHPAIIFAAAGAALLLLNKPEKKPDDQSTTNKPAEDADTPVKGTSEPVVRSVDDTKSDRDEKGRFLANDNHNANPTDPVE